MVKTRNYFHALPILGFLMMGLFFRVSRAQMGFDMNMGMAPSPAPLPLSSDSTAIDQGIAYVLLLVALAITYLVH